MDLFVFSIQFESFYDFLFVFGLGSKSLCINFVMRLSVNRTGNLRSHIYQNDVKSTQMRNYFINECASLCINIKLSTQCEVYRHLSMRYPHVHTLQPEKRRQLKASTINFYDDRSETNPRETITFYYQLNELVAAMVTMDGWGKAPSLFT